MKRSMTRLWEAEHPYYCAEGNYYVPPNGDAHLKYDSWAEFHEEWGDADRDMNAVFRWDWITPDEEDYDGQVPHPFLLVHWVLQRKAILQSTECPVSEDDEPAVREWLRGHAETTVARWAPLLD